MKEIRIKLDILIGTVLRQYQQPHCAKDTFLRQKKHKDYHCSAFMSHTVPTSLYKVMPQQLVSVLTD